MIPTKSQPCMLTPPKKSPFWEYASVQAIGTTALAGVTSQEHCVVGKGTFLALFDDQRLIRSYILKTTKSQVIHKALMPIYVNSFVGAARTVRVYIRHFQNNPPMHETADGVKCFEAMEPFWPKLGIGLREVEQTLVAGENFVDMTSLIADYADNAGQIAGMEMFVCIAMKTSELNDSDQIIIDFDVNDFDVEFSEYTRDQQFAELGTITPFHFWPFDAQDALEGQLHFRSVRERRDHGRWLPKEDYIEPLPIVDYIDGINYDTGFPNTAAFLINPDTNEGHYFVEFNNAGDPLYDLTIGEAWSGAKGIGLEPDNLKAIQLDPENQSFGFIQSWVYSDASQSGIDNDPIFDQRFDQFAGNMAQWFEYDANTGEATVRAGMAPGINNNLTQTETAQVLGDGDVVEFFYWYDHTLNQLDAQVRVRKFGESFSTTTDFQISGFVRVTVPLANNPAIINHQFVGYLYTSHPTFGSTWLLQEGGALSYADFLEAAHWCSDQWQAGYKVLPYQLWEDYDSPNAPQPTTGGSGVDVSVNVDKP